MNKTIPIAIIIVGVMIAGAVIYTNYSKQEGPGETGETGEAGEILSAQKAAEKAINFINQSILKGSSTASLMEVYEENGLYKLKFTIDEREVESYITLNGKLLFPEAIVLTEAEPVTEEGFTIGNFSVSSEQVCREDGKPIIYFFGSDGCGYCKWEHPVIDAAAAKFEGYIAFHNNMNTDDDQEIFQKYSTGGVPTLVFGCKYYRVGAGSSYGEEKETEYLTALICKLTDNQPADVCNKVQDLINEIK